MPIYHSSSSAGAISWTMLTSATSPGQAIAALFRLGDNSGLSTGTPESVLASFRRNGLWQQQLGHLTWDPLFGEPAKPFTASSQVNFDLSPGMVRWAVGTNDFLNCDCLGYERIKMVEIEASAIDRRADALVRWDLIEVTLHHADESRSVELSPCLPRVSTAAGVRRSASARSHPASPLIAQHAQMSIQSTDVVRLQIRGQVSLRFNAGSAFEPDDLMGRILVHTE